MWGGREGLGLALGAPPPPLPPSWGVAGAAVQVPSGGVRSGQAGGVVLPLFLRHRDAAPAPPAYLLPGGLLHLVSHWHGPTDVQPSN